MQTTDRKSKNKRNLLITLLTSFFIFTFIVAQAQTVRYVKENGTGNGSSWADASGSLQEMINASAAGDEVWVDAGIYKPTHTAAGSNANPNDRNNTFLMKAGVKIYGGFTATETSLAQRNLAGNKSILSGDIDNDGVLNTGNVYVVVTVAGDMGGALLDGFTITGGNGGNGGGINAGGAMTFSNLIIRHNTGAGGGGIALHANCILTNIVIADNISTVNAGGIHANTGTHYFTNVTIANNRCNSGEGGAIFVSAGTLNMRNSIIWGNTRSGSPNHIYVASGAVNHSYNLLEGGALSGTTIVAVTNPLFTDAANGDYSLTPFSHAINIGNKTLYDAGQTPDISYIETDIVGNLRMRECQIDLGAYESPVAITPTVEGRVYVREGANGKGSSWDDAYPNLAYPLRMAAICGIKEILVAEGTYYPMYLPSGIDNRNKTFLMVAGVKIYGGFNATLTGTTAATPPLFGSTDRKGVSILSGDIGTAGTAADNAYSVVKVSGSMGSALLDGFTVTGGNGGNGGGINAYGSMTFSNLIIRNNTGNSGGGLSLGTGCIFTNILVADNTAATNAGGIHINEGTHYFTNITIANNTCNSQGGAIFVSGGTMNIRNSIIWGNKKSGSPNHIYIASGAVNHSYNLLEGGTLGNGIVAILNPKFTDAAAGDYSLKPESPAIDIGNKAMYNAGETPDISGIVLDLAGESRVRGCNIDLGTYESPVSIVPTAEGRVYVKQGATGKGSSWDDAYPNLAFPLRLAAICGIKEILVAEGTYYPMFPPSNTTDRDKTFLMVAGVKIYGGFNNTLTGTTEDPPFFGSADRNGVSILSGDIGTAGTADDNAYSIVKVSGNMGDALLDGFTITEGNGGNGGGINAYGSMTFSNLIIRNNTGNSGGGLSLGTGCIFTNILVADNTAATNAGGIHINEGTHYFTNITIANNTCNSQGGAIFVSAGTMNMRNSIIWGNKKSGSPNQIYIASGAVNHSYNLLEGGTLSGTSIVAILNPQFNNAATGDYSLKFESPAVDMGNKAMYDVGQTPDISGITTDLAGNPRIQGGHIDLGVYETSVYFAPTAEGIVYVKEGATGKGTSWDDAYPNIAYPLRLATIYNIKEIYVAEGTYYPMFPPSTVTDRDKTFLMVAGIKIYGGFNATLTGTTDVPPFFGSADRKGVSILSGDIGAPGTADNAYNVVKVSGNMGSALLDGFTITGGNGGNGGGINAYGSMTFSNLIIRNNTGVQGGGLSIGTGCIFTNILVADNIATSNAGGIHINEGTHYFTNITIANNTCSAQGGAIFVSGGTMNVRNSIIWGNKRSGSPNQIYVYSGAVNHSYNLLEGGALSGTSIVAILDPKFTDAAAGDYNLQPGSPAIDMGNRTFYNSGQTPDISGVTTDLVGSPRVQGEHIDLGPYEASTLKPSAEGMVYVIEGGKGEADGSSWDDAYPNLAYPLRMAKICGVKAIFVAEGTYYPMFPPVTTAERDKTFFMVEGVKVYGGFNGTLTGAPTTTQFFGSEGRNGVSILSGDIGTVGTAADNAYNVVKVSGNMGDALLDGFTITEGNGGNGGGINAYGSMTFSNLIIRNNTGLQGGGLSIGTGCIFTNILVADNIATSNAGGIHINGGTHYFTNITIANNTCSAQGGAIFVSAGTMNMRNSIIWGNKRSGSPNHIYVYSGAVNHSYNLLEGGTLGNGVVAILDPKFTDASTGDYNLQLGSPAIDMGNEAFYNSGQTPDISDITTDLVGSPRIHGEHIDLGPYETTDLKPSAEGMVYVIEGGKGEADGSSWDDAYPNLAYPLRMAKICGVKAIFVAGGTYYPMFPPATTAARDKTFFMVEGVKVYGGFNGTLTGAPTTAQIFGSEGRNGVSILNGDIGTLGTADDNAYNVVKVSGNMGDALLDGFTITGGNGGNGGGINAYGSMTFSNLIIRNNTGLQGGGLSIGTGCIFTNILVADNIATSNAGGIHINGGTHYFTNITIANNTCSAQGGAIFVSAGTMNMRNSIIWGNKRSGSPNHIYVYSGAVNHSYNLLEGGALSGTSIVAILDPKFTDAAVGDYRLQSGSPAIDMGDATFYNAGQMPDISDVTADIVGNPRISGFEIDLGPYEFTIPIMVINDTAMTKASTPVTIDVLENDDLGTCDVAMLDRLDIVAGNGPHYGAVNIAADRKLTYTPNSGHRGIDSLKYEIECEGNVANAWVHILTVNPLSKEYRACPGASVEIGFEAKTDIHYDWYEADGITPRASGQNTITVTKDASGVTQTYLARPFWKNMAFPFDTVKVHPALDTKPEVADIRVTLCPSPARTIYLTGYLDSLPYHSAVKWTTTGIPAITDVATGALNTGVFPPSGVFTYTYTRYSECNTSWTKGKAYVHIPQGKIPRRHDTIVICRDQAAAINVSSIFGFELGGVLKYDIHDPDNAIFDNVTSTPLGALFFDGAKAYDAAKTNPAYNVTYHGAVETGFIFEYDYSASNCIVGKKRIVIVIEN